MTMMGAAVCYIILIINLIAFKEGFTILPVLAKLIHELEQFLVDRLL
jgi:hypothetical protein